MAESSKKGAKKRITDDEWAVHRTTISRLYLDEGKDVREVRDIMKRDFGFEAHEKAYKRKFEDWGLTKNVPKEEGLFMVKKRAQRRDEGKNTIFFRRRRSEGPLQLVPDDKVDRIADRYAHDLSTYPDTLAITPNNIEYATPNEGPAVASDAQGWPFPPTMDEYLQQQQQQQAAAQQVQEPQPQRYEPSRYQPSRYEPNRYYQASNRYEPSRAPQARYQLPPLQLPPDLQQLQTQPLQQPQAMPGQQQLPHRPVGQPGAGHGQPSGAAPGAASGLSWDPWSQQYY